MTSAVASHAASHRIDDRPLLHPAHGDTHEDRSAEVGDASRATAPADAGDGEDGFPGHAPPSCLHGKQAPSPKRRGSCLDH